MKFNLEQIKLFMTFWNVKKDKEWAHTPMEKAFEEFFGIITA